MKTRGQRDLVTVVGHAAYISAGEFVTASGFWITDRTHGLQFKAEVLKPTPPTTAGDRALSRIRQMRSIGPAMGKRIDAAFGEATFDMTHPDRLTEVAGICPFRDSRITRGEPLATR